MSTTTFFTAANTLYEPFVVPYAISVLHHNNDAVVEICVEDIDRFNAMYSGALAVISNYYQDRFLIRGARYEAIRSASVRFLEEPTTRNDFTYIGDIDILILEGNVTAQHVQHVSRTNLPYSNRLRPPSPNKKPRLTGLHFTHTDAHYPLVVSPEWSLRQNAEELLHHLVVAKGLPLPDPTDTFRPAHGLHLSVKRTPTRAPDAGPPWAIADYHVQPYLQLLESAPWQEASAYLHPAYRALLLVLEVTLQASHSDRLVYRRAEAVSLWSKLALEGVASTINFSIPTPLSGAVPSSEAETVAPLAWAHENDLAEQILEADARLEEVELRLSQLFAGISSKKKWKAKREILKQAKQDLSQIRTDLSQQVARVEQEQGAGRLSPDMAAADLRIEA